MSGNAYEPRRLRDLPAGTGIVGRRLARQLQILSSCDSIPRLSQPSRAKSRGRFLLVLARLTAVALILLVVVGGASASAVLLIRKIQSTGQQGALVPKPAVHDGPRLARPRASRDQHPAISAQLPQGPISGSQPGLGSVPPKVHGLGEKPAPPPAASPSARQSPATKIVPLAFAHPTTTPAPAAPPNISLAPAPVAFAKPVANPPDLPSLPSGQATERAGARRHASEAPSSIAEEAALLKQALLALRQARNPKRALEMLDLYGERYPNGMLALEASAARAQALVRLGQKTEALRVLDALPLLGGSRAVELRLTRAELRSLAGRCNEAVQDFEDVLERRGRVGADDRARALYGRASCRARLGDAAGAEKDRQIYLKEFPDGAAAPSLQSEP